MSDLLSQLRTAREEVNEWLTTYRSIKVSIQVEADALDFAVLQQEAALEAQVLLQKLAASIQEQAHAKIAQVVSHCLSAVFDEPYAFRLHFERKRGRTEARLAFERKGVEFDPLTSTGGGAVDVAAFALRCACLLLAKPQRRRLLLLDEPFRFVSAQYSRRVADMVQELSRELGIQFVIITHKTELIQGAVLRLSRGQGIAPRDV